MVGTGLGGSNALEVEVTAEDNASESLLAARSSVLSLKTAVVGLGAVLGAVAAGGLAASAAAAASFEQQLIEVEKVTNPETAREMGDAIQDMASTMPIAQKELAEITAQAGRFGVEGEKNMRRFTRATAEMAIATDLSSQRAGESFARLATLLDEPVDNVRNMGNAINELSNTMATSSSEIVDATLRSSATLTQLGASSEQIFALNAAMNEASESAERAGTRLRRLGQELTDPKKAAELADALGMTSEEFATMRSESPVELIRMMAETMGEGGEQADALRSSLSTTSRQALTGLSQNLEGLSEAQETANKQMDDGTSLSEEYEAASGTFNAQLQVTKNRLRNIGIQIGEVLLPHLSDLLAEINRGLAAFSEFNDETDGTAGAAAGLGGSLVGLASGAALVASHIGLATSATAALGTALSVLTGPVGIAIALVTALAVAWQQNLFGIQGTTKRIFNRVRSILQTAMGFIVGTIIRPRLRVLRRLWALHGDEVKQEIRETMRVTRNRINRAMTFIDKNIIRPGLKVLRKLWSVFGDEIIAVARFVERTSVVLFEQLFDGLITAFKVGLNIIQGDWGEAWDEFASFAKRSLGRLETIVDDGIGTAIDVITGLNSDFKRAGKNLINELVDGIEDKISDVKNAANDVADAVSGPIKGNSPPEEGPLSDGVGGRTLVQTYAAEIEGELGALRGPTEQMAASLAGGTQPAPATGGGGQRSVIKTGDIIVNNPEDGTEAGRKIRAELKRFDV